MAVMAPSEDLPGRRGLSLLSLLNSVGILVSMRASF
jgi:hypothetical protein